MSEPTPYPEVEPDTKNWTWVIERPCPECGFDASQVAGTDVGFHVAETAHAWIDVLGRPDVAVRPAPGVWSPLEYACHVRDVHGVFGARVARMIAEDDPEFENWDQDAAAVDGGLAWLAVLGVVASAMAVFFYIRLIVLMFFTEPEGTAGETTTVVRTDGYTAVAVAVAAIGTVALGVLPGAALDLLAQAAAFVP